MKNLRTIEKSAKSKEEAIKLALLELGLDEDDCEIKVLEEGSKGFLGLGGKDALVRVTENPNLEKIAVKALSNMVEKIVDDVEYKVTSSEKTIKIEMNGPDMGILIGKRGATLDSLQYLTSLAVNRVSSDYIKVILNTENYREKRHDTLVRLARRLASQVIKTGKSITLEPMRPNERRIIHSTLQNNKIVQTVSVGEEPNRKVVIEIAEK